MESSGQLIWDTVLIGTARTIDSEGGLLIRIVRTLDLEGGLLRGIVRTIDLGYCIDWNCPHNSFRRRSINCNCPDNDLGYCLLIGIARTIDLDGGLLSGIRRSINWNCPDN